MKMVKKQSHFKQQRISIHSILLKILNKLKKRTLKTSFLGQLLSSIGVSLEVYKNDNSQYQSKELESSKDDTNSTNNVERTIKQIDQFSFTSRLRWSFGSIVRHSVASWAREIGVVVPSTAVELGM